MPETSCWPTRRWWWLPGLNTGTGAAIAGDVDGDGASDVLWRLGVDVVRTGADALMVSAVRRYVALRAEAGL